MRIFARLTKCCIFRSLHRKLKKVITLFSLNTVRAQIKMAVAGPMRGSASAPLALPLDPSLLPFIATLPITFVTHPYTSLVIPAT